MGGEAAVTACFLLGVRREFQSEGALGYISIEISAILKKSGK